MKDVVTSKRIIGLMSLLLAIVMMFSACGGNESVSSENASSDTATESETELSSDEDLSAEASDSSDAASGEETSSDEGTNSTAATSSKNTTQTASTSSKAATSSTTNASSNKYTFGSDPYASISDSVKSKEVHVLMWRKYDDVEQKMVNDFQKKTGIKVRTTVTTEKEYTTKLISLISGGDSPDVVQFSAENFPGIVTRSMKPLNKQKFKLEDSCWNTDYMDYFKVNGRYFGVAIKGSWSCEDCNYVTIYSKTILKSCGITETPWELYKKGQWNWDTQNKMATKIVQSGKTAIGMHTYDLMMLSAGSDFVTYNGSKYTNVTSGDNKMLLKSWQQISELYSAEALTGWDSVGFRQGKVALLSGIAWQMYTESNALDGMTGGYDNLEAVPIAGPAGMTAYTPVRPKVWGVANNAKNEEGAAYFLRYFLDPTNCDMSSTFYNKQFEEVFNIITAKGNKKAVKLGNGVINYKDSGAYSDLLSALARTTSNNLATVLNSKKGVVQTGVDSANKDLSRIQ